MNKRLLMVFLILLAIFLFACDGTSVAYRINFDSNGGTPVSAITSSGNTILTLPDEPTRPGYRFLGWYFDDVTFEDPFTANTFQNTPLISSMTVYAKWEPDDSLVYHQVTFITNGGSSIDPIAILEGGKLTLPDPPVKVGFTFAGWSADAAEMIAFDAQSAIMADLILYAFWNEIILTFTISFDSMGGSSVTDQTVIQDEFAFEPAIPALTGYRFDGWYLEETFETPYVFETVPVTGNLTLYAKWINETYQITYVVTNETFAPSLIPFDSPITLPALPDIIENDGLMVVWYEDEAHTIRFETELMPSHDITLYGLVTTAPGSTSYDFLRAVPSTTIINREGLSLYLDYMFFNRIASVDLLLDYDFTSIPEEVSNAFDNRLLQVNVHIGYSCYEGDNEATVTATYQDGAVLPASSEDQYLQKNAVLTALAGTRLPSFDDFAVNDIQRTYPVQTSDQLYYVLEQGYRPIFETPDTKAEMMYEAAKSVLRSIISDDMTATEKLDAIYRFLVFDVTYDKALLDKLMLGETNINRYNGFYLEGVFTDGRAVCDGISKAFTVLARIEGLDVIRVIGAPANPANTILHAWNKVRINGVWYVIDATSANLIINGTYEFFNYRLFMVTDAVMAQRYVQTSHLDVIADTPYNHYENIFFTEGDVVYDHVIDSQAELNALFRYYDSLDRPQSTIDVMINFDYGESLDEELLAALSETSMTTILPVISGDLLILIEQIS